MKRSVRDAWVAALRSGEFKQTSGVLHKIENVGGEDIHSYCCLGVLCELGKRAGEFGSLKHERTSHSVVGYGPRAETWFVPIDAREWAGMASGDPVVSYNGDDDCTLSALNDTLSLSFEGIADIIEEQIPVTDENA